VFCREFLMLALWFFSLSLAAQSFRSPAQSAYLLSVTGFPQAPSPLSVSSSPSLIPGTASFMAGVYAENQYGISGLNALQAGLTVARKHQGGGMLLTYLGNTGYHELSIGLHYGRSLGKINIGLGFRYHQFSSPGLQTNGALAYTISSSWKFTENISGAITLTNPFVPGTKPQASIAPLYALSFGFGISEQVFVESRIIKEEGRNLQPSIGMHYRVQEKFSFYAGCWPFYFRPFLGLGWHRQGMCIQVTVNYHPSLGASPGLLAMYASAPQSRDR